MLSLTIRGEAESVPEEGAYEAMRRFYQAQQAGDKTAKLVRTSDTGIVAEPVAGGDISAMAARRIVRQEKALKKVGIALPPPVYAPGTRVLPVGDANFQVSRRKWEDSPEIIDSLRTLWRLIRREERHERIIKLSGMKMLDDGAVNWGDGPVYLEALALKQLLKRAGVFPNGSSYLASVEPDLRAYNWKKRVSKIGNIKAKVRIRRNPLTGRFAVFALVSPTYGTMDIDELSTNMAPAFDGSGLRGSVLYDSGHTNLRIDGRWHADHVIDLAAGDVFQVGVQVRTNDSGLGSVYVHATALRNLCLNLLVLAMGKAALYRRIHQGDMSEVGHEVRTAIGHAQAQFDTFATEWGILRQTPIEAVLDTKTKSLDDLFRNIAPTLDSGVRRDAMVELLLNNYKAEPGGTLADVINAVSRSHLSSQIDQYRREKIEAKGRELVHLFAKKAADA